MKVSKIVLVLAVALAVTAIAVPAGALFSPFGLCGFGFPFGFASAANFQSSFVASSSFNTFGGFGFPFGFCGVPFGFGGCGLGGFGFPFGFC